jgi:hypothetical protein
MRTQFPYMLLKAVRNVPGFVKRTNHGILDPGYHPMRIQPWGSALRFIVFFRIDSTTDE